MNLERLPPTISVEQAADVLGVSRSSAYRAVKNDEIPTFRVGRRLLVPTAKLLAMLMGEPAIRKTADQADALIS